MSQLPINPLSPDEQQKTMEQMYLLMDKQVQSYYEHRHMGHNTSVAAELAQELMASIEYTINQGGDLYTHATVEEALRSGREVLKSKLDKAKALLKLVEVTAPFWQAECRWTALNCLRDYINQYDYLHFAHKGPEALFYPALITVPEGVRGMDECLFYLHILWIENQIMAAVPADVQEQLWDALPDAALNQCEYLLRNGVGKAILRIETNSLIFSEKEREQIITALTAATETDLIAAADRLCDRLAGKNPNVREYVMAAALQLRPWLGKNAKFGAADNLFL